MNYRSDKVGHGYLPTYQEIGEWVGPFAAVLEIGVANGDGMELFRDLFSASVYGLDIKANPDHVNVHQGDQADPDIPRSIYPGPWDLIVDDASHANEATRTTLINFWPTVRPGGFYVIEDWNHLDPVGMWQGLEPLLVNGFGPNGGGLTDVDSVTVRSGMIIIRKS